VKLNPDNCFVLRLHGTEPSLALHFWGNRVLQVEEEVHEKVSMDRSGSIESTV
jgi:hypothetical protein